MVEERLAGGAQLVASACATKPSGGSMNLKYWRHLRMKRIELELSADKYEEVQQLMAATGSNSNSELFNNALTLFRWAVRETEAGRMVASVDESNDRYKELTMPALSYAAERARQPAKAAVAAF